MNTAFNTAQTPVRGIFSLSGLIIAVLLSGCITSSESMQVSTFGFKAKPIGSLIVQAGDGNYDNATAAMEVSDENLRDAIEASVLQSGLFNPVVSAPADYLLYAAFVKKNQPLVSFTAQTEVEIYWRLINQQNGQIIWNDSIITKASGGVVGLGGNNRMAGAANAIRANIRIALTKIFELRVGAE